MSRLFQIHEDELVELERLLPDLALAMTPTMDNRLRIQFRRLQTILSNVRWNYGPPRDVEIIPVGDPT